MQNKLVSLFLVLFFTTACGAKQIRQIEAFNFDFDDNTFITNAHIHVCDGSGHREDVSTADWALVKNELGKPGKWLSFVLCKDGLIEFGDTGPQGPHAFRHQIEEAVDNSKNWKGPSWDAFVAALSDESTRQHTTIITARLHSPDSILEGLEVLHEKGQLKFLPLRKNIYSVGWPGLPEEFKAATPAESKAKVMRYLLSEVEKTPLPTDATDVLNREGNGNAKLHLWGFSDDDFDNISKALSALEPGVHDGLWPHVKILIFFTGLNNPKEKPRSMVIKSDGTTRPTEYPEGTWMQH